MKRTFLCTIMMLLMTAAMAQSPLNGTYYNKDLNIRLVLDVDSSSIAVPGMEGLETCYGYMSGTINSMWYILKVKKHDGTTAIVRAMCDKGDNAQDLEMELKDDQLSVKQINDAFIKGIKNRKYVKLPKPFVLKKE